MSSRSRYRVTELAGYGELVARAGSDELPGVTFDVHDDLIHRVVASFRSEHVAGGLPHNVRVSVARRRAHDRAAELELEHVAAEPVA